MHMIAVMLEALFPVFDAGTSRSLAAGEPLFHAGDPVTHVAQVRRGRIELRRATGAGSIMILQRAGPGDVLAEASVYSDAYHCDARAAEATQVMLLPVSRFRRAIAENEAVAELWAAHLARAVQSARMRAELRNLRTVAERLDAWIDAGGRVPARGRRQDLAAELGVTREALYRELSRRKRTGQR